MEAATEAKRAAATTDRTATPFIVDDAEMIVYTGAGSNRPSHPANVLSIVFADLDLLDSNCVNLRSRTVSHSHVR